MSLTFWKVIIWACAIMETWALVYGIISAVRTRVAAGKSGIVKACIIRSTLILHLVLCALFVFCGINRMNDANKYFSLADKAERVIDRLDSIVGDTFQQVAEKTSSENPADIRERIAKYRELGRANKTYATLLFVFAASDLVSAVSAFWYITEEGIMLPAFKTPEPFYAVLNGNKIELNYSAQFKNANKVTTFKATPENLAVFGRFIEWEQEQAPEANTNDQSLSN